MFKIGDAVIHPKLGAGIVLSTETRTVMHKKRQFYKISILGKTRTELMIPALTAEEIGLRSAITMHEAEGIWKLLASDAGDLPDDNKSRKILLDQLFVEAEPHILAKLVRDLAWRRIQGKKINQPGRDAYKKAMTILAGELAVTEQVDIDTMRKQIENLLETNLTQQII